MRLSFSCFIITVVCGLGLTGTASAQKWLPGHFTDKKGNVETGMIWLKPPGRGPINDEAFIEFRDNDKEQPYKLSASDLKSFVVGRDSFVVAAEPMTGDWQYGVDFVKVVLDEDVKLYVFKGGSSGSGGGLEPGVEGGVGGGTGGYGGGVGVGLSIPIGHGGGGGNRTVYYYGENTAQMKELTNANFVDIMSDIMGDEPDVVDAIHQKKYDLGNMDKLLAYFKKVQASHTGN